MSLLDTKMYHLYLNESVDAVLTRLGDTIDKDRFIRIQTNQKKPFSGYLKGNKFKIQRITNYRNSLGPIINGQVSGNENGTIIALEMNAKPMGLLFLFLWVLGNIGMLIMLLLAVLVTSLGYVFIPLGIAVPVTGVILFNRGYKKETKKAEDLILNIFRPNKVEIKIVEDD